MRDRQAGLFHGRIDAITANAATAKKYHLTRQSSIADLKAAAPDLVIGASPEFQARHQGLEGLKSVYGVTFRSMKALDAGGPLTVAALKGLVRPEEVASRRGLPLEDVAPAGMLRARALGGV